MTRTPRQTGRAALWAAILAFLAAAPAAADPPRRVVSMNLCTDQLAMMLAAPGQLHSVSYLAADPRSSAMADAARAYRLNRALAEDIYLMQPDLVVTGRYSPRATVSMLRRLGVPVVLFDPAQGLDDVRAQILRMGNILGRTAAAEALAADFDRRLAALEAETARRPGAALYFANGYTAGDRTLAGQILIAAGFENAAAAAGLASGGVLPLELLALLAPEALITARPYPRTSRSEAVLGHPVVRALGTGRGRGAVTDRDWICGTPHVLRAIDALGALRRDIAGD